MPQHHKILAQRQRAAMLAAAKAAGTIAKQSAGASLFGMQPSERLTRHVAVNKAAAAAIDRAGSPCEFLAALDAEALALIQSPDKTATAEETRAYQSSLCRVVFRRHVAALLVKSLAAIDRGALDAVETRDDFVSLIRNAGLAADARKPNPDASADEIEAWIGAVADSALRILDVPDRAARPRGIDATVRRAAVFDCAQKRLANAAPISGKPRKNDDALTFAIRAISEDAIFASALKVTLRKPDMDGREIRRIVREAADAVVSAHVQGGADDPLAWLASMPVRAPKQHKPATNVPRQAQEAAAEAEVEDPGTGPSAFDPAAVRAALGWIFGRSALPFAAVMVDGNAPDHDVELALAAEGAELTAAFRAGKAAAEASAANAAEQAKARHLGIHAEKRKLIAAVLRVALDDRKAFANAVAKGDVKALVAQIRKEPPRLLNWPPGIVRGGSIVPKAVVRTKLTKTGQRIGDVVRELWPATGETVPISDDLIREVVGEVAKDVAAAAPTPSSKVH